MFSHMEEVILRNRKTKKNFFCQNVTYPVFPYDGRIMCVLSDSMLNQINGDRLSDKKDVKVMCCSGCTVKCMYTHLPDVFVLNPKHIVLHIGTNYSVSKTSDQVLSEINSLKSYIEKVLPTCNVIISTPIVRADDPKANTILKNLNIKLKRFRFNIMDNSNIKLTHIARKGLHLSKQGAKIMSSNLISLIILEKNSLS